MTATLPTNFDELKAYLAALNAGRVADTKSAKIQQGESDGESDASWTESVLGLAKTAVMTFNDIGFGPFDKGVTIPLFGGVGDAYLNTIGVTWSNTYVNYLPETECGWPVANEPTPPWVAGFGFNVPADGKGATITDNSAVDASMTSTDDLIKEVSFYYATPNFVPAAIEANPKIVYTKATVSAWTGPAGTGKKLETMQLDWTTGDNLFNFVKVDLKLTGVAKSISISLPLFDGVKQFGSLYFDNVAIMAADGKATVLAAGALEAEEKFAEIEKIFNKEPAPTEAPVQIPT